TSPHSWLFQVATSSGLVGLGAFLSIVLVSWVVAFRGDLRPLAVAGATMLGAFLGTGITSVNEVGTDWLMWLGVGAIIASGSYDSDRSTQLGPPKRPQRRQPPPLSISRGVAIVIVMGTAVVATVAAGAAMDASRLAYASRLARLQGHPSVAIDLGMRATTRDGGRAQYWHELGLAYVSAAGWPEASSAFARARDLAPFDARYIGDL